MSASSDRHPTDRSVDLMLATGQTDGYVMDVEAAALVLDTERGELLDLIAELIDQDADRGPALMARVDQLLEQRAAS